VHQHTGLEPRRCRSSGECHNYVLVGARVRYRAPSGEFCGRLVRSGAAVRQPRPAFRGCAGLGSQFQAIEGRACRSPDGPPEIGCGATDGDDRSGSAAAGRESRGLGSGADRRRDPHRLFPGCVRVDRRCRNAGQTEFSLRACHAAERSGRCDGAGLGLQFRFLRRSSERIREGNRRRCDLDSAPAIRSYAGDYACGPRRFHPDAGPSP
jgi:hypothetical protein